MIEKMKKTPVFISLIVVICLVIGSVIYFGRTGRSGSAKSIASSVPVVTVQDLMNPGAGGGSDMVNRFAGVVETQDSWSVNQNQDVEVKEVFVKEGQEVKKGDPLFTYDTDKYESDLEQAKIDLERMQNELASTGETIDQLMREKANASSSEQAAYTIQIQEQELAKKQKDLDIRSKEAEIKKLEDNIKHATVNSEIDGVIQSIRSGQNQEAYYGGEEQAFITVMKVGEYRIKGTVNEQNFSQVQEGIGVLVHSRTDASQLWRGTVTRIDTENPDKSGSNMYYGGDSSGASSKYPFYVELEDSTGLIMGQHVYLEIDYGQTELANRDGIWLPQYYIDESNPETPFVWAENNGRLERRNVQLGERDDDLYLVEITEGLELTDAVAVPDPELTEGMPAAGMQ